MNVEYRLEPFGRNVPAPAKDLAMLHAELLPRSPITEFGTRFMQRFYYTDLPREGYILGEVAYVDDRPAGFIVATYDSNGFMKAALRRLWWRLAWEMAVVILLYPHHIRSVWEAINIMRSRSIKTGNQLEGEILSFGVLPEYLDSRFIRETGLHIANDLFQWGVKQLQAEDLALIRAIVDADNNPARFFFHGLGWTLEKGDVSGWKVPVVEFVWRP